MKPIKTSSDNNMKKKTVKSKSSMAARLGVSRSTLYQWKASGAPVERGDAAVLEWAMNESKAKQESNETRDAKLAVLRETERRLKLANDEREGKVANRAEVASGIARGVSLMFGELERIFLSELPPLVENRGRVEIAKVCRTQIERMKVDLRKAFTAIA